MQQRRIITPPPPPPVPSDTLVWFADKLSNPFGRVPDHYVCYCCALTYPAPNIYHNKYTGTLLCVHCYEYDPVHRGANAQCCCAWSDYTGHWNELRADPEFTLDPYESKASDSEPVRRMKNRYALDRMLKVTRRQFKCSVRTKRALESKEFLQTWTPMDDVQAY